MSNSESNCLNVESVLQILRMRDFVPRFPPGARLRVMKARKNANDSKKRKKRSKKEPQESSPNEIVKEVIDLMKEDTRRNRGSEDEKAESTLFDEQTLYNTARNSFEYGETVSEEEIRERMKAIKEKERKSRSMLKFNELLDVVLTKYGIKQQY